MKIFKRILITLLIFIVLIATIIGLFFRAEAIQLYYVITMFDQDNISWNFKNMDKIFPVSTVTHSQNPYQFIYKNPMIELPPYFIHEDSTVNTQNFLDYTMTDGLLILKKDTIIYEKYGNGFNQNDHHISWSMSKSVISALFGIAIAEGYIKSIEETVTDYVPALKNSGYNEVRIKDVLQMSTGVAFNEDYSDFNSDINRMGRYFAFGMPMDEFAGTLKRERPPGTYNHYVSINTHVLGMILKQATGQSITRYMEEKLWSKIGTEADAYWIIDKDSMEFVLGGLNATLRDYTKIGKLYLDSGRWEGQQVVPESWVIDSITPDAPHLMPGNENSDRKSGYGYQWWIPDGAEDEFQAQGIYTQFIYIDPDKATVIVKLSSNYHFKNEIVSSLEMTDNLFRTIVSTLH